MAMNGSAAIRTAEVEEPSRPLDTPEFLTRLAEDMRSKSGSDLPLSCFVEQVRMQLAGKSPADQARTSSERLTKLATTPEYKSSDCFRAWAMPD
jgi:hypothetical protein